MNKNILLPAMFVLSLSAGCNQQAADAQASTADNRTPTTEEEKQAYSVGASMAKTHKEVIDEVTGVRGSFDMDMYLLGVSDALNGELKFADDELEKVANEFRVQFKREARLAYKKDSEERKIKSAEFLAENKKKEGIVTTDSGLQYRVIKEGNGEKLQTGDGVEVLYTGRLTNGEIFDTTSEDNMPRPFDLLRVVKGWQEALQLMSEGSKWEIFVPPELGYGDRKAGAGKIPPNSVMIFEMELVNIIPKDDPSQRVVPLRNMPRGGMDGREMPKGHP